MEFRGIIVLNVTWERSFHRRNSFRRAGKNRERRVRNLLWAILRGEEPYQRDSAL